MAKKKMTIDDELKARDYKTPSKFVWFFYNILAHMPFFNGKYHVEYKKIDDINDCKGPAFIIWNHLSRRDYLFIKNVTHPKRYNMVAGYSEFHRSHLAWLFKIVKVIPKKNFSNDLLSIRAMTKVIKNNGTIAFSPEGMSSIYGCNQPIVPGTGRFLQFFHIPIYFVKLEGSYLTSNKVDITDRPGKVTCTIYKLFDGEDLLKMTPEEIENRINEEFRFNDYAWNKTARIKFKSHGKNTSHLNDLIYKCPKCGKEFSIECEGNDIYCKECGYGATLNDYYDMIPLHEGDKMFDNPTEWFQWQRQVIIDEIRKDPNYTYKVRVKLGKLLNTRYLKKMKLSEICGEGELIIDHAGIHYRSTKDGKEWQADMPYKTYYTGVIENDCTILSMYIDEVYYDFTPETNCMGKILLLIEEMHRYHYNTWKNFPWNDYMYEGKELGIDNKK